MGSTKRILVALDSSPDSALSLGMATTLAAQIEAQIETLFIEDVELVRLAGLPFAAEFDRLSGVESALNLAELNHTLQKRAEKMRALVQSLSKDKNIYANFKVVRGHYIAEAMQREAEILFMMLPRYLPSSQGMRSSRYSTLRKASDFTAPIYVYYSGGDESKRAITLGAELATMLGADLVVLLPSAQVAEVPALKQQLASEPGKKSVRFELVKTQISQCAMRVAQSGCTLFVLPKSSVANDSINVQALRTVHCPLVLVA